MARGELLVSEVGTVSIRHLATTNTVVIDSRSIDEAHLPKITSDEGQIRHKAARPIFHVYALDKAKTVQSIWIWRCPPMFHREPTCCVLLGISELYNI
jgi:hypothetical protein